METKIRKYKDYSVELIYMMYLHEAVNKQHEEATIQERKEEREIMSPANGEKCVECQTHHHYCCQYRRLKHYLTCYRNRQDNI